MEHCGVMFLTVNTQHSHMCTEGTVIWYVLTMVHSQYTAEQRYFMVKTYLNNNNIYQKYLFYLFN